jgi:hypothetical protein
MKLANFLKVGTGTISLFGNHLIDTFVYSSRFNFSQVSGFGHFIATTLFFF